MTGDLMVPSCQPHEKLNFIQQYTPVLFSRFGLSFRYAFNCADYFIIDIKTGKYISKEILFVLDPLERCLVVSRFFPEIYKQNSSKYLSATCFYLLIRHFIQVSDMTLDSTISLTAKQEVFKNFYAKLKDFDFHAIGQRTGPYVCVTSPIVNDETAPLETTGRWLDLIADMNHFDSANTVTGNWVKEKQNNSIYRALP
jgi:hypothetical protein